MSEFDDLMDNHPNWSKLEIFRAGRESICSQREAYQRGYRAGAKRQREKDADALYNARSRFISDTSLELVRRMILAQEITDD